MTTLSGRNIDKYELGKMIAQGQFASVYLAKDPTRNIFVVKVFDNFQSFHRNFIMTRFKIEIRRQKELKHKNIVSVIDILDAGGNLASVYELVNGIDLREFVSTGVIMKEFDFLFFAKEFLSGIIYAHNNGVLHGDLKPTNVLIAENSIVKITDFGLSQSVRKEIRFFEDSIYYTAPEVIDSGVVTEYSDIYSIGCIFYEVLTGHLPFYSENENEVIDAHHNYSPEPIERFRNDIASEIIDLINRAMEKDPEMRFHSAEEFFVEFQNIEADVRRMRKQEQGLKFDEMLNSPKTFLSSMQMERKINQAGNNSVVDRNVKLPKGTNPFIASEISPGKENDSSSKVVLIGFLVVIVIALVFILINLSNMISFD